MMTRTHHAKLNTVEIAPGDFMHEKRSMDKKRPATSVETTQQDILATTAEELIAALGKNPYTAERLPFGWRPALRDTDCGKPGVFFQYEGRHRIVTMAPIPISVRVFGNKSIHGCAVYDPPRTSEELIEALGGKPWKHEQPPPGWEVVPDGTGAFGSVWLSSNSPHKAETVGRKVGDGYLEAGGNPGTYVGWVRLKREHLSYPGDAWAKSPNSPPNTQLVEWDRRGESPPIGSLGMSSGELDRAIEWEKGRKIVTSLPKQEIGDDEASYRPSCQDCGVRMVFRDRKFAKPGHGVCGACFEKYRPSDTRTRLQRMVDGDLTDQYEWHQARLYSMFDLTGRGEMRNGSTIAFDPQPEPLRTFFPDTGEDFELSPDELRAWRSKQ